MIGPKLPALLDHCGYEAIDLAVQLPTFMEGSGKRMAELTWQAIRASVLSSGLASEAEARELDDGLADLAAQRRSIMSLPRIFRWLAGWVEGSGLSPPPAPGS